MLLFKGSAGQRPRSDGFGPLSGKKLGDTLQALLEEVLEGRCPNRREDLLARAEALLARQ